MRGTAQNWIPLWTKSTQKLQIQLLSLCALCAVHTSHILANTTFSLLSIKFYTDHVDFKSLYSPCDILFRHPWCWLLPWRMGFYISDIQDLALSCTNSAYSFSTVLGIQSMYRTANNTKTPFLIWL